MHNMPHIKDFRFRLESLEERRLLAWGAFPQLIDQDLAVSNYAQYNGAGQTIAVIDTGADYTHPALRNKYLAGYDFVSNDSDPKDTDGHGTGVSTLALGNNYTFNGATYQGVATGARLIALRVDGGGRVGEARYEQAFQWIIDNRARYNITVVNASFGSGHYTTEAQRASYADEIAQLAAAGVFIAASSGNDGAQTPYGIEYPGADPNVFSVGSIDVSGAISKFTERGPILDILAPGNGVPTAYLDGNDDHIYLAADGTSFSAPIIAGAAAILKQIDPTFTPRDIISILRSSGVDNLDGDNEAAPYTQLSFPRLDLDNAIALALTRRSGAPSSGQVGLRGQDNAIRFDRDGVLYYTWYDLGDRKLKYATRNTDGDWSGTRTLDNGSDVGQFLSMALTSTGKPAVAYYDVFNANLKYAEWDGGRWNVSTVDSAGRVGLYTSLTFDQFDDPIITYYSKASGDLKLAFNDGAGWAVSTIDATGDVGRYSSVAISNTGQWSVAYENSSTGQYKFARRNANGTWSAQVVDDDTRIGGGYVSLAYDTANRPAFSYYDAFNADLKFARFNGSSWETETVASNLSQGLYTNLHMTGAGEADILYYSKSADAVFRATGNLGDWSVAPLVEDGGRHVYYARYGNSQRFFSYYQPSSGNLIVDNF
jgi:hypothetical protein